MTEYIIFSKSSTDKNASPKYQDTITVFPAKERYPPLEGENSTKMVSMWNLKHDISSPKCYELLLKTELKVGTSLDVKNFYNHIKMCLNALNILQED